MINPTIEQTTKDMVSVALKHEFPDFDFEVETYHNLAQKSLQVEVMARYYDQTAAAEKTVNVIDEITALELHRDKPAICVTRHLLRVIDQLYGATGRKPKDERKGNRETVPQPGSTYPPPPG